MHVLPSPCSTSPLPTACLAGNGLSLIGFGSESVAMGGADAVVARDTTALNTNPGDDAVVAL